MEQLAIQAGDVVHFTQLFNPESDPAHAYRFGIVAGTIPPAPLFVDPPEETVTVLDQVIVYLYDPGRQSIYRDELGGTALYSFSVNEIGLCHNVQLNLPGLSR